MCNKGQESLERLNTANEALAHLMLRARKELSVDSLRDNEKCVVREVARQDRT